MDFIGTVRSIIFSPGKFFDGAKGQKQITPAFTTYAISVVIGAILLALVQLAVRPSFLGIQLEPPAILLNIVLGIIIALVAIFIGSGIIHIFAPHLGGKNGFYRTFNTLAYGLVPAELLAWLVAFHLIAGIVIGILLAIWSTVLLVMGIRRLHEVSLGRAILILIVPAIVIFAILAVFAITLSAVFLAPYLSSFLQSGIPY